MGSNHNEPIAWRQYAKALTKEATMSKLKVVDNETANVVIPFPKSTDTHMATLKSRAALAQQTIQLMSDRTAASSAELLEIISDLIRENEILKETIRRLENEKLQLTSGRTNSKET